MKKISFLIFVLIFTIGLSAQIITNPQRLDDIETMLHKQQLMLGERSELVFGFLNTNLTANEMQAMKFLYAYMPLSDLADYTNEFFLANVQYSLKALDEIPWAKTVPEDEFLHFVLPVRVNNENLDSFRIVCYQELSERVKGLNMYDAALEVNHWCHEYVTYKPSDSRTSSPLNTMKYSFGRCGEESVFTVAAMRAVGIPARQVYTPRWAHTDDNHAWVEVWIDGKWYYLGACEPEPFLNMGWFSFPATRAMLVHTRAYGKYFGTEEVINQELRFSELNLIGNYAETKVIFVKVFDNQGNPLKNAQVDFLLYNYAELYPIATRITGQDGTTTIRLGLGEIIVWASMGNNYDFQHISVATTDTVVLRISEQNKHADTYNFTFIPPRGSFVDELTGPEAEANRLRLMYEDSLRSEYHKTFLDSVAASSIEQRLGFAKGEVAGFIVKSYGNHAEIISFLNQIPHGKQRDAIALLQHLSDKDLRDAKASILIDHLKYSRLESNYWHDEYEKLFDEYILNCRIDNEQLSAWRSFLNTQMSYEFIGKTIIPALLEQWTAQNIRIDNTANLHSRAPLTPIGVYKLRVADIRSRNIFFVALCRSFGIPARLHPETRIPQYYFAAQWNNAWFGNQPENHEAKGKIVFLNPAKDTNIKYYNSFTIGKLENGRFSTLQFPWDKPLNEMTGNPHEVFAGRYLLVTGRRLTDGTVMSQLQFFTVEKDQTKYLEVKIPAMDVKTVHYGTIRLKNILLPEFETGAIINLGKLKSKKGILFVFIDPDKEPSKHVMHDIALVKKAFENSGLDIFYVLSPSILSPTFHSGMFKGMPQQGKYLLDTNDTLSALISEKSGSKTLPMVCLISPKNKILFLSNGYRIGTGDEILRLLK